jgi:uncharacterized protein YcaQ
MREIALVAARRHAVATQRFAARRRNASMDELVTAIERLGCVQIDSISVVDRSQRLVLAARCGRVPAGAHDALLRSRRVFEYWAHEACLLPVRDEPYFRMAKRADGRYQRWFGPILKEHRTLADEVLAVARERGEIASRDFGGAGSGYWEWTPAKRVFEALWTAGDLAVYERRGFERMYDLTERVIPAEHRATEPDDAETLRHFLRRTLRSRGVVTRQRLADYYRTEGGMKRLAEPIADLVAAGEAVECRVGEWAALCDPAAAALAEAPPASTVPVLLCPFDNLIWDREETRRLFGFTHALEIYKPAAQRVWGYYVLPLLAGDRIVGRVDLKSDRKAGLLRPLAVHWEGRPQPAQLSRAMERLAHALQLQPSTEENASR